MATALTVYGIETASTTLSTANQLVTATGGTSDITKGSLVGGATGYGEVYAQGNAGAWAAGGSIGTPSGHGWLFDVTTLEGQTIIAGSWTAKIHTKDGTVSPVCNLFMRAYKRSSGGVYTLIGTLELDTQTLASSSTAYTIGPTSFSAVSFATGDKLYIDHWANFTSNSGTTNQIFAGQSSTSGGIAGFLEIDTPGYNATAAGTSKVRISDGYGGVFS